MNRRTSRLGCMHGFAVACNPSAIIFRCWTAAKCNLNGVCLRQIVGGVDIYSSIPDRFSAYF
jgi:hypothetical protein